MSEVNSFIPALIGKLFVSFAVRRWGGAGSFAGAPMQSPLAGQSWTWGQYLVAVIAAQMGSMLVGRTKLVNAKEFRRGAYDLILTKAVWTEGFARSPWMQSTFGNTPDGQVQYDPASGNMMISQGGRWESMQGLVEASPLDGLVEASPLDGSPDYSYGHLLPQGTSAATAKSGRHHGDGYVSQYHAAYTRG